MADALFRRGVKSTTGEQGQEGEQGEDAGTDLDLSGPGPAPPDGLMDSTSSLTLFSKHSWGFLRGQCSRLVNATCVFQASLTLQVHPVQSLDSLHPAVRLSIKENRRGSRFGGYPRLIPCIRTGPVSSTCSRDMIAVRMAE